MRRGESIFELDPNAHEEVERGFEVEGSNLSGVSARCSWAEQDFSKLDIVNFKEKHDEHVEDNRLKASFPPPFHTGSTPSLHSLSNNVFIFFFVR